MRARRPVVLSRARVVHLTDWQMSALAWAIAAPGRSIHELGELAGHRRPHSGHWHLVVRSIETHGLVTIRRDWGRPHAPTVVDPTPAALAWHHRQWADPIEQQEAA